MRKLVKQNSGKEDAKIETFSDLSRVQSEAKAHFLSQSVLMGRVCSCLAVEALADFFFFFCVMQVPDLSLIARHLLQ